MKRHAMQCALVGFALTAGLGAAPSSARANTGLSEAVPPSVTAAEPITEAESSTKAEPRTEAEQNEAEGSEDSESSEANASSETGPEYRMEIGYRAADGCPSPAQFFMALALKLHSDTTPPLPSTVTIVRAGDAYHLTIESEEAGKTGILQEQDRDCLWHRTG